MSTNGYLVISLDFELVWGVFDVVDHQQRVSYFENTRRVIPSILEEFSRHDIHATWAVVGMLFNRNWEEWKRNQPNVLPQYVNTKLSPYKFGYSIISDDTEDMVFAPDLIKKIKETAGQEIGTHTYSHYYCLEQGQDEKQFKADLQQAIMVAYKMDIKLTSLVFPRNQLKEGYLKICADLGIQNIRSNPNSWYWEDTLSEAFLTKLARSGDAYIPFGKKSYSLNEIGKQEGLPVEQKASRFLRPVEGNNILRRLKIERIKREMEQAAKKNKVYHLWWHPHNFGEQPDESINDLKEIFNYFDECRKKYNFKSLNMQELYEVLNSI